MTQYVKQTTNRINFSKSWSMLQANPRFQSVAFGGNCYTLRVLLLFWAFIPEARSINYVPDFRKASVVPTPICTSIYYCTSFLSKDGRSTLSPHISILCVCNPVRAIIIDVELILPSSEKVELTNRS